MLAHATRMYKEGSYQLSPGESQGAKSFYKKSRRGKNMEAGDAEGGLFCETPPPYLDQIGKKGENL